MNTSIRYICISFVMVVLCVLPCKGKVNVVSDEILRAPKDMKCVIYDREGYVWYGNSRGLYRDDKFNLKFFPVSNSDLSVESLAETPSGDLWIGTEDGLWVLDKGTYSITRIDSLRLHDKRVTFLGFSSDGSGWVGCRGVLSRYSQSGEWQKDYPLVDRSGRPTTTSGFCESRSGDILLTSYSAGVYCLNKKTDTFELRWPLESGYSLGTIIQDKDSDFYWVHDFDGHIYRFDPDSVYGNGIYVSNNVVSADGDNPANSSRVRQMIQDGKHGFIWVSTRVGLIAYRPDSGGRLSVENISEENGFIGAYINGILPVDNGIRVICYDHPGVSMRLDDNSVMINRLPAIHAEYQNEPAIEDMALDVKDAEKLWFIQFRSGLLIYDLKTNKMGDGDDLQDLRLYRINHITASKFYKGVWASRTDSPDLSVFTHTDNLEIKEVSVISLWRIIQSGEYFTDIFEDNNSRLWIGTNRRLIVMDLRRNNGIAKVIATGEIKDIGQALDGNIWAAGKNGLFRMNPLTSKSERFTMPDAITAITFSHDGIIWAGSENGRLFRINPASRKISDMTLLSGLDSEKIENLLTDSYGHIWISNENRVTQFNPNKGSYRHFRSGGNGNLSRFICMIESGGVDERILLGGIGGMMEFRPTNSMDTEAKRIYPVVADVKVAGKSIYFDKGENVYDRSGIRLDSDASNIEIFFTSPGHSQKRDMRFAYRIKGYDNEWNYTDVGWNRAFYNSIPSGKHLLQVKVCDENNQWTDAVTSVRIYRAPPLYATWWAILLYTVAGCLVIAFILSKYLGHVKKNNEKMWADSTEMIKMRKYLESPVTLPDEEFREYDKILLKKITEVVEKNISDPNFCVNDLASGVNMSKSTLARKLKAISGMTPSDFIRKIRIQHAKSLLESQNHTVAEVADMVGFDERRYFTSIFKKETGVTPSAYLKGERAGSDKNISKSSTGDSHEQNTESADEDSDSGG